MRPTRVDTELVTLLPNLCTACWEEQKNHFDTCLNLQAKLERDPEFLSKIITGDETGLQYNLQIKHQFMLNNTKSPGTKTARQVHCNFSSCSLFCQQSDSCALWICPTRTLQHCGEKCSENDVKDGIRGIVFCIMTMHLTTLLCVWISSHQQNDSHSTPFLLTRFIVVWHFFSQNSRWR